MKKLISVLLLVSLCLCLTACAGSEQAQAASLPSSAPADSAPTPEPTPEPVDLNPLVEILNKAEMEQRAKGYPFVGVYEVSADGRSVIYKLALDRFEMITFGADMGNEEYVKSYNKTLDEMPAMATAIEKVVHETAPEADAYLYLMLEKHSDQIVAVIHDGQIIYDAINGVGDKPEGEITPIIEPETTPEPSPAA